MDTEQIRSLEKPQKKTLKVGDRTIGYVEFGTPGTPTILFWHGFPGGTPQAQIFFEAAQNKSMRVIALDRPGYGQSSPSNTLDWRQAVTDALTVMTHLKVDRVHVVGVSGGGPYSRGFAKIHPEKVLSLTTICGLGSFKGPGFDHFGSFQRVALKIVRFLPAHVLPHILNRAFVTADRIPEFLEGRIKRLCDADRQVLAQSNVWDNLIESFQVALSQGNSGMVFDLKAYWQLSDKRFYDLNCEWHIWHGLEDKIVPHEMALDFVPAEVAKKARILARHGHYSLPVQCADDILSAFVP